MRTILSLGLALVLGTGVATLTGCEKKDKSVDSTKKVDTHETPGGGKTTTTTESSTETKTTPDKDKK
jgi:hypothetical protein